MSTSSNYKFAGKDLLLDTNVLIYQLNGRLDLADDLSKAKSLHVSAITVSELYAGTPKAQLLELKDYLAEFITQPVNSEVATLAGAYKSAFPQLKLKDLLIAATAELQHLTLVTADKKDFWGLNSISPIIVTI